MNYRTLGRANIEVSEVGFGTWQLANDPGLWEGADRDESLNNLHRFAELGGTFIDTAWVYGWSDKEPSRHPSQELIGLFLKESPHRHQMVVASKIPPKNMRWPAWKGTPIEEVFPVDHIKQCVDDTLRSLGVDCIPLMQFHVWQDDFCDHDEWKETIQAISKAGKVKHWGISTNDYQPSNCIRALETGLIEAVQVIFNIFHQRPIERLFPYAREHNIGLIARVPLDEGGLTDVLNAKTTFTSGDFRSAYFTPARLNDLQEKLGAIRELAPNIPIAELALRFILSFPDISTVIPGMRKRMHVEKNLSAGLGNPLDRRLLDALRAHSWERNFYPDRDPSLELNGYVDS